MRIVLVLCLLVGAALGVWAAPPEQASLEATSLLGQPLYPPEIAPETLAQLEENLLRAKADYQKNPDDSDAIIWLGRRTAYLGRYREAIAIYTRGIEKHPNDPRLYRHRGHRYLTVREIDKAIADLENAASLVAGRPDEIEPDGAPNPKNIPTSTTQTNIWYHLGLAYYLKGDFANAHRAYARCLELSKNDDMVVATTYWLYLTLRRLGRPADAENALARIHKDMNIIENFAYHSLLLVFKGERAPETVLSPEEKDDLNLATVGYGVGAWYLCEGQPEKAAATFQRTVAGKLWPAFGHLAAEAELARSRPQASR